MKRVKKQEWFIVVYTDPSFPMDDTNVFQTVKAYKSVKDFNKMSGMEGMKVLLLVPTYAKFKR